MKVAIIFFSVIVLASCNQGNSGSTSAKEPDKKFSGDVSDNEDILGSWFMCPPDIKLVGNERDACPKVVFDGNGSGYVQNDFLIKENFHWSLESGQLTIDSYQRHFFPDTVFQASFTKNNNEIELSLSNKDTSYHLAKAAQ